MRVITPGWMGESCMKWLTDITVREDEAEGYYMDTAYRYPSEPIEPGKPADRIRMLPVEAMVVKSVIVQPTDAMVVHRGPVVVEGVAWTGEGRIATVDISTDDGRTWQSSQLCPRGCPVRLASVASRMAGQRSRFLHRSLESHG